MPRSKNINTYDSAHRALLSREFIATLAGGSKWLEFEAERDAKRVYFHLLAVVRAARETGTNIEKLNSYRLGIRPPAQTAGDSRWRIELYDRDLGRADDSIADLIASATGKKPGELVEVEVPAGADGLAPADAAPNIPKDLPPNLEKLFATDAQAEQAAALGAAGYTVKRE